MHKFTIITVVFMILLAAAGETLLAEGKSSSILDPRLVAQGTGASGFRWIGGNEESPLMFPGRDCISCHASGEGPQFITAGTVYVKIDEKNDDFGVEGVTVQLTDAKGTVLTMVTNIAGNFMSAKRAALAMPYTAKVIFKNAENAMATPQSNGNCMLCHSASGSSGAPGRIVAP